MQHTMPQIGDWVTTSSLTSTEFKTRTDYVRTKDVPALYSIMAIRRSQDGDDGTDGTIFTPLSPLLTKMNEDGSFAAISDIAIIEPEARRSAATFVLTTIYEFDPENRQNENNLRTMLARVVGARQSRSIKQVVIDCLRGKLDDLVKLYAGDGSNPRFFGSLKNLLCFGQLKRSTYQAERKKFLPDNSETPEQESETSPNEGNRGCDPETQAETEPEQSPESISSHNHDGNRGEQYELFQDEEDEVEK